MERRPLVLIDGYVTPLPDGDTTPGVEPVVVTKLIIDGGSPSTIPEHYVLRFDFGGVV